MRERERERESEGDRSRSTHTLPSIVCIVYYNCVRPQGESFLLSAIVGLREYRLDRSVVGALFTTTPLAAPSGQRVRERERARVKERERELDE